MKFCQAHWDRLRAAIDDRGLSALVADSGEKAASNLAAEMERGRTIDTFDPLMAAHMAIANNAMTYIERTYMQNPLMMMANDPAHPEWECPICCLNWLHLEHNKHCTKADCDYPATEDYAWMIGRAADDMLAEWRELGGATS